MANTIYELAEWRIVIEPELTQVYVFLIVTSDPLDAPMGVQGWHHKTFPKSMSVIDILQSVANGDQPLMWPLSAPK